MDLHVTVVGAPGSSLPAREIVVDTEAISTGAVLAERLKAAGWVPPFTVGGVLLAALGYPDTLYNGSVIVAGTPARVARRRPVSHLAFVVHAGPDAGQVQPLSRGVYVIGRAAADIVIADPALSRRHARLTVTEDSIVLEDLDSVNGCFVDGEAVTRAPITVSAAIRIGSSHCRLGLLDDPPWSGPAPEAVLEPVRVAPEMPRKPSRVLVVTALLPLVLGVVLALTTGMWFFLAFSGLSAVTGLVPLLTYRRAARIFWAAVYFAAEEDRRRRVLAVPDPGTTGVDALRSVHATTGITGPESDTDAGAATPDVVLLRVGTADQAANLAVRRGEDLFEPPDLPGVPLLVPCSASTDQGTGRHLTIAGDPDAVEGLTRSLLLQVSHPSGGHPNVVCWGSAKDVPHHARFLPNVLITRDPKVLAHVLARPGLALIFHFSGHLPLQVQQSGAPGGEPPTPSGTRAAPRRSMNAYLVRLLPGSEVSQLTAVAASTTILLAEGTGRALIDGSIIELAPDAVSARTFARTARALAEAAARRPPGPWRNRWESAGPTSISLPSSASLWSADFAPADLASSVPTARYSRGPGHPSVHLGSSRHGAVAFDVVKDGPHLLVAGTTGSGKSEFLRTLVLGLAIDQPPEHLTLLLIDYKGGSGLGDLAALPHCVGSMSDLSSESTARAFVSLRAELRRRETICAEHGARDLDHLRQLAPRSCPPRLVVVVDEFRMLVDDVPAAMPDLLKIAALGRSLGVHLVLATQKAQGAVPPDMRANITSTVLLRVRTALESQDLLGSAAAAEIPVDLPGRAYLRRGNEPPVEFQVATCSTPPPSDGSLGWVDLDTYMDGAGTAAAANSPEVSPGLLREAVAALTHAARTSGNRPPCRPVQPPLPDRLLMSQCTALPPADPPGTDAPLEDASGLQIGRVGAAVDIGLADLPHRQKQRVLQWRPQDHSHLAFVGLPGGGGSEAISAIVATLPRADPGVHLYLLDGDGSLGSRYEPGGAHPLAHHVGALVQPQETTRGARVLERLAELPAVRAEGRRIVLAITGWNRWITQFRAVRGGRAEEDLQSIVRDGALSGITVLILGDRDLTASRFFSLIPNRVYLPFGAHQEITLTWPKTPPIDPVPGRAFVQGRITGRWGDSVCQMLSESGEDAEASPPSHPPFTVLALPTVLELADIEGRTKSQGDAADVLTLGVQGDELDLYQVAVNPGEVFLVLGHRGSGRTNLLRLIGTSPPVRSGRRTVITPPMGAGVSECEEFWRAAGLHHRAATDLRMTILLVDDVDRLAADVQRIVAEFVAGGAAAVLTARPSPSLMTRVPLALQARATGQALILAPRASSDGDLFGVRLDVTGISVLGRGVAVDPTGTFEVQTALVPAEPLSPPAGGGAPPVTTAFFRSPSPER